MDNSQGQCISNLLVNPLHVPAKWSDDLLKLSPGNNFPDRGTIEKNCNMIKFVNDRGCCTLLLRIPGCIIFYQGFPRWVIVFIGVEASGALNRYFNVLIDESTINGFGSANSIMHFDLFPSVLLYLPKVPVFHDGRSTYGIRHTVYFLILDVTFFRPQWPTPVHVY